MTTEERNNLIESHLFLVKAIASRIQQRAPSCVEFDDLYSAGVAGLLDAAGRWDESKGVKFATFAQHRIKGEMLDSLRRENGRAPDQAPARMESLLRAEGEEAALDPAPRPDRLAGLAGLRALLEDAKASLSERHRTILTLAYGGEELSQREISERLGLSQGRISQLRKEALELVRQSLEAKGIAGSSSIV